MCLMEHALLSMTIVTTVAQKEWAAQPGSLAFNLAQLYEGWAAWV